ncbi:MAG TPA: tetratricopeptide repeat protein [Gemmataceae bacterium]|nr:tetratricopeptide repeat protein [Gemmataceae bacterium]
MAQRWQRGERCQAEEFLVLHPELWNRPEIALELIYEEMCLCQDHDEKAEASEFIRRFPQWEEQIRILFACRQLWQEGSPKLPREGESLGDFHFLSVLGKGLQGRVYLATQSSLADRPVVVKLTPLVGGEHQSLARLQHTHIVPIYSFQDFPARNLRALCMPFFGGTTLDRLLHALKDRAPAKRTGRDLLDALQQTQADGPMRIPIEGPACQFFPRSSYVQAICWIGACLADALHYAGERGLVHLDVKASNVLVAADGQPMLLDFHLACEPIAAGSRAPDWLGGTPSSMAPEHRRAMAAVRNSEKVPLTVDGRADIYSLGALLYEALGGPTPLPSTEKLARELRRRNRAVSIGLADLISKCLAPNPRDRFPSAEAVAADLRRHLADLPMRGVGNRSFAERWQKWRRRRPSLLPLCFLVLSLAAATVLAGFHGNQRLRHARTALVVGSNYLQKNQVDEAISTFKGGLTLADGIPFSWNVVQALRDQVRHAERQKMVRELHLLIERLRPYYAAETFSLADAQPMETRCRRLWEMRGQFIQDIGQAPESKLDHQSQTDLLDLAILWTDLRVRLASETDGASVRMEALKVLDQAEALFGPSCVLDQERRAYVEALGLSPDSQAGAGRPIAAAAPRTAWEHYALGRAYLQAGEPKLGAAQLDRALELQPDGLWPNFYKGVCAYRLGQYEDALVAFSAAVALAPGTAACFYNRGRAYAELGHLDRALQDYDHALRLDPALAPVALSRAELRCRQQRYDDALADVELARRSGIGAAVASYHEALVHVARQDRPAASRCLQDALRLDPACEPARQLLGKLHHSP